MNVNNEEKLPEEQEQQDFYQKLRTKLVAFLGSKKGKSNKFTPYLMFVPDLFHLLIKTVTDAGVDKTCINWGIHCVFCITDGFNARRTARLWWLFR